MATRKEVAKERGTPKNRSATVGGKMAGGAGNKNGNLDEFMFFEAGDLGE